MSIVRGQGFGDRAVLARAAVLEEEGGRPTLNPDLLVEISRRLRRGDGALDIILVAEDAARALLLPLPRGLNLAGVAAESPLESLPTAPIPVVADLGKVREQVEEGQLVILDAPRNRVLLHPTAEDMARLQNGPIVPRYRVGSPHVPAYTQSGREITVWAALESLSEIPAARESGADGLLILPGGDLIPSPDQLPGETLARWRAAADAWGAGDIALYGAVEDLDPLLLCRFAALCRLHWTLSPEELFLAPGELRSELKAMVQEGAEGDEPVALPQLAAWEPEVLGGELSEEEDSGDDLRVWDRIFAAPQRLTTLSALDILSLPPLMAILGEDREPLPSLAALGIAGVVTVPAEVPGIKDAIREQE
ncbi:MAG: hypothetical protein OHK0029_31420 [Armatimonadaceae bacterium]